MRSKEIYVSSKTKRRLYWLSQLEQDKAAESKITTQDEMAEHLLNEKTETDYPNITILEKRLNALEDQLVRNRRLH